MLITTSTQLYRPVAPNYIIITLVSRHINCSWGYLPPPSLRSMCFNKYFQGFSVWLLYFPSNNLKITPREFAWQYIYDNIKQKFIMTPLLFRHVHLVTGTEPYNEPVSQQKFLKCLMSCITYLKSNMNYYVVIIHLSLGFIYFFSYFDQNDFKCINRRGTHVVPTDWNSIRFVLYVMLKTNLLCSLSILGGE